MPWPMTMAPMGTWMLAISVGKYLQESHGGRLSAFRLFIHLFSLFFPLCDFSFIDRPYLIAFLHEGARQAQVPFSVAQIANAMAGTGEGVQGDEGRVGCLDLPGHFTGHEAVILPME